MAAVTKIFAWEVLDSRGTPTVAVRVELAGGANGTAIAPQGASTGEFEVPALYDADDRFGGRGCRRAVAQVLNLSDQLAGVEAGALDERLLGLPSNVTVAASMACHRAAAASAGLELWEYLSDLAGVAATLPTPMVNIFSGGRHAEGGGRVQDYLAVPLAADGLEEAIEQVWRVRRRAAHLVESRWGRLAAHLVADEGGLALPEGDDELPLELLTQAIEDTGLAVGIAIDVAATQWEDTSEIVDLVALWCAKYPVCSVEDILGDDDWNGWVRAASQLPPIQVLGDDLLATNASRVERAAAARAANAVLIKPNQVGTLSGAFDAHQAAKAHGMASVVSARSGDTEDSAIADIAVGWAAGQIKIGSLTRSERLAKYNRLLELAARYDLPYSGWSR